MSFLQTFLPTKRVLIALGAAAVLCVQIAMAQTPSQKPLLSRDGGGVKPNIMLTMDDSGSMMFQHMPEETVYAGSYTVANPVGGNSVRMDPGDNAILSSFFIGTVAARPGSTNWRQKLLRAADTNTIYYNPEVRYRPWPLAAGGRMGSFLASAAPRDPMSPVVGGTINLTDVRTITNSGLTWCFRTSTQTGCGTTSTGVSYDPGLYYRLKKNAAGQYLDPTSETNYDEFSINAAAGTTYAKYAARTDCAGTNCTRDEERQNFSNWFTYYRTRNLLARGAVLEAFSESTDTFRLGYGRINQGTSVAVDGVNTRVIQAGVRDFTRARKTALFDWLYALPASGGTPLRRAMQEVGNYYSRADGSGPWSDNPGMGRIESDKSCRRSYQIMVTDGYWNDSVGSGGLSAVGNQDNTNGATITGPGRSFQYVAPRPYRDSFENRLADYAMKYWKNDLRSDLTNNVVPSADNPAFWQHMVNFTVGLGVRGTLDPATDLPALTSSTAPNKSWGSDEIDDLWHAALNSRGEFFSARDPSELANAIRSSIGQTLQRELREAGVATAATTLQDGNRKYVPQYKTGAWSGDIQAFTLDSSGQAGAQVWAAEAKLPAWNSRKIYTWDPGAMPTAAAVTFTWAAMSATNQAALGSVGTTYTSTLVDFLRGDRSKEGEGQPFRARQGVLGDFINSNPVLVKDSINLGYGSLPSIGASYASFLAQKASRTAVLFAGSNDGMLHAFKDTNSTTPAEDGKEIFAYVPRTVYPSLSLLSSPSYGTDLLYHQFYVDGPLMETDAHVRAPGASLASWRNYLLGSLGAGGRAIYALDVTDTANLGPSTIRWELSSTSDSDLGYVFAPIEAGVLPNGEWVAVFGNGHYSAAGNAVLFVVNLETGTAQKLVVDPSGSNGLGGVGVQRNSTGQITNLFAGDLKGNLWKFDYNSAAASRFQVSGGAAFFSATSSAGVAQPITQPPVIYDHSQGGKLVVFGTGLLVAETDANSTATQAIYGVWDKTSDSVARPMGRSALASRAITQFSGAGGANFYSVAGSAVDWVTQRGWVIDLDVIPGLRVVYPPQAVTFELALISTVAPARNVAACDASTGLGINFLLPVETGLNPSYKLFDTNGDGLYNNSDSLAVGFGTNADGIDRVVYSPAKTGSNAVADGPCAPGYYRVSIQNTTGQMMTCVRRRADPPGGGTTVKDRIWRRIINPPIR